MIVLDESIHKQMHRTAVAAWYPGQVVSAVTLRPRSVIKDDAIPMLLLQADEPTDRIPEGLTWLQRCLRLPDFRTKAARMGKIIRLTPTRIEYYESDRRIQSLSWSP
jgi:hypothetical protein